MQIPHIATTALNSPIADVNNIAILHSVGLPQVARHESTLDCPVYAIALQDQGLGPLHQGGVVGVAGQLHCEDFLEDVVGQVYRLDL